VGGANLIRHPVGALLPQAQGRGDKTQQFVHILIAYPPAVKDKDMFRSQVHSSRMDHVWEEHEESWRRRTCDRCLF